MKPSTAAFAVSLRRAAVCLAAGVALVAPAAAAAAPAGAVTVSQECRTVVDGLRADLGALAPPEGTKLTTDEVDAARVKAGQLFSNAMEQHPTCEVNIDRLQAQLAASARKAAQIKGTPFWGPLGWAWNNVYYKVFSGNDIMMAMFGWALLLSPFILVFATVSVMRGSQGSFRRPYVPPYLRTEQ